MVQPTVPATQNTMAAVDLLDARIRFLIATPPFLFPNSLGRFRSGDPRFAAGRDLRGALLEAGGDAAAARLDTGAEEVNVLLARLVHFLEDLLHLGDPLLAGWRELRR